MVYIGAQGEHLYDVIACKTAMASSAKHMHLLSGALDSPVRSVRDLVIQ